MNESNVKNLLAHIYMKNGKAVRGFYNFHILEIPLTVLVTVITFI